MILFRISATFCLYLYSIKCHFNMISLKLSYFLLSAIQDKSANKLHEGSVTASNERFFFASGMQAGSGRSFNLLEIKETRGKTNMVTRIELNIVQKISELIRTFYDDSIVSQAPFLFLFRIEILLNHVIRTAGLPCYPLFFFYLV